MLRVNCPKTKAVITALDQKQIESITFRLKDVIGLSAVFEVEGDETVAKAIAKKTLSELPEMKYQVISVALIDDQGRML